MIYDSNTLLPTGSLAVWLLFCGLFFPRFTLFVACLIHGAYPPNPLPGLVNFIAWLCFPRFLLALYVYVNLGPNNLWFWAYLLLGIAGFFGETGLMRRRFTRRTTVSRDGRTITTVEEEF